MQKVNKSIIEEDKNRKIVTLEKYTPILCTGTVDKPDENYCNACPIGERRRWHIENKIKSYWCEKKMENN